MNDIAQDIYVCKGLFYKLMNRIYFFQMLLCFWVIECCSSLPRFCSWHLICYRKWIFPLIWIFCSDSLLGGHDEWRNVPGGLCLAKWMRGHRLLGTCRYCVTWCRSGCECLWEAMLGTSLTQVWNTLGLEAFHIYRLSIPYPNAGGQKCSTFHIFMHNEIPWRCGPILNTKCISIS